LLVITDRYAKSFIIRRARARSIVAEYFALPALSRLFPELLGQRIIGSVVDDIADATPACDSIDRCASSA